MSTVPLAPPSADASRAPLFETNWRALTHVACWFVSATLPRGSDSTAFPGGAERPISTRGAGHFQGVCLTWRQTGPTLLTACWKASPCYLIHFRFVLLPSSSPFICPSLCSAAASELSHTESSIIRPSSSVWVSVKEGGKWRERAFTEDNKTHTAAQTSPILVLPFYCFKSGPKNETETVHPYKNNWKLGTISPWFKRTTEIKSTEQPAGARKEIWAGILCSQSKHKGHIHES